MTDDEIDALLLSFCGPTPRKVAFVVGSAMDAMQRPSPDGIDDLALGRRVKALVEAGRLNGWGNLDEMRFSEVASPP